jgi:uncharacterized protein YndB with AHSA1/START domain
MPKQRDLTRIGKKRPAPQYAKTAGRSDAAVKKATGRDWTEWVRVLDAAKAADLRHRDIAKYVSSIGTPDWWSQMVTVGYERIRGLRDLGQRRDGAYEASKSRTFAVPVSKLFDAFAKPHLRARWLPGKSTVRTSHPPKTMRLNMDDGTLVAIGFTSKGDGKSAVAVLHSKLADRSAAEKVKASWATRLDALAELLG